MVRSHGHKQQSQGHKLLYLGATEGAPFLPFFLEPTAANSAPMLGVGNKCLLEGLERRPCETCQSIRHGGAVFKLGIVEEVGESELVVAQLHKCTNVVVIVHDTRVRRQPDRTRGHIHRRAADVLDRRDSITIFLLHESVASRTARRPLDRAIRGHHARYPGVRDEVAAILEQLQDKLAEQGRVPQCSMQLEVRRHTEREPHQGLHCMLVLAKDELELRRDELAIGLLAEEAAEPIVRQLAPRCILHRPRLPGIYDVCLPLLASIGHEVAADDRHHGGQPFGFLQELLDHNRDLLHVRHRHLVRH
mmetsp:Transcript_46922/g.134143  ORF Transcript_46922/g.134143 Transcript_46922/m.134143 type:complete len:305 (+) Transcript_46922:41-955(+)